MEEIYQYTDKLDYDNILLFTPKAVQGGGYYAKVKINSGDLYIQTPKIFTKNGINITGKKVYSDLLFEREHLEFINFIQNIEERIREIILQKGELWFTEKPNMEDIEERWNSSIRQYKSKKYLLRTKIERSLSNLELQIWDENEKILTPKDINEKTNIIGIFEIAGLKFSSTSFQLDIQLKQMMKFDDKKLFSKCLIKTNKKKEIDVVENLAEKQNVEESVISQDLTSIHDTLNENTDDDDSFNDEEDSEYTDDSDNENTEGEEENDEIIQAGKLFENTENEDSKISLEPEKNTEIHIEENEVTEKNDKVVSNHLEETEKKLEKGILEEVNLEISDTETMKLKKPKDVYSEIYKSALMKAREAKKAAIKAYMDANKIKKQYLLDDIESSDAEDLENFSE